MKYVVDMNLEPGWADALTAEGLEAQHWSTIGDIQAADEDIAGWAARHDCCVITQDLDFGRILALSGSSRPSVVILRSRNSRPMRSLRDVVWILREYTVELTEGAILVLERDSHRLRILPLD